MKTKLSALLGLFAGLNAFAQTTPILSVKIGISNTKMTGAAAIGTPTTAWNNLVLPAYSTTDKSQLAFDRIVLLDQTSAATTARLSLTIAGTSTIRNIVHSYTDSGSLDPQPSALMSAYLYYWWSAKLTNVITGLAPNATYRLYGYGSGNANGQGSGWSFDAANGGASMDAKADYTGTKFTRNVTQPANLGHSYVQIDGKTTADGTLTFYVTKPSTGNDPYVNGFQLTPFPIVGLAMQPASSASVLSGGSLSLAVAATGEGTITYQWRKGGVPIAGNASAATATLTIANMQDTDAGAYDVIVTNPGGSVTSSATQVTIATTAAIPVVETKPSNLLTKTDAAASLYVVATGTHPINYQWQKSTDGTNYTDIAGATNPFLAFSAVKVADAGLYRVKLANSAGATTSPAAPLTVAPIITETLANTMMPTTGSSSISVKADAGSGAPSPMTYQWFFNGTALKDGGTISGTSGATLTFNPFSLANSGLYSVTVTNAAGAIASNSFYLGAATTLTNTLWPAKGAIGVNPDTPMKLTFKGPVQIGSFGKVTIYDASNDSVVESYNLADYQPYVATYENNVTKTYPAFTTRTVQGTTYQYQPVAAFDNEVWIRPSSGTTLKYGKTYYVTIDPGVILDATGATFPGITGKTSWIVSTRATAPSGSTLVVAADGSGDFTTIQAACDVVPANNVASNPYTILIGPGIYREHVFLGQNRNFVTLRGMGPSRLSAQIIDFAGDGGFSAVVRMMSTDIRVQNLTMENPIGPVGAKMTLLTTATRQIYENVLIKGWQDTLALWNGTVAYFNNCEVWGSVDFIYAGGMAVFEKCDLVLIRENGGFYTAPSTPAELKYGLVFLNSRFLRGQKANGQPTDVKPGTCYLMRPWVDYGQTAVINCTTDDGVPLKGWAEWDNREKTCRALEYGTKLLGSGTPIAVAQRQAAGAYWVKEANPADFTLSAIFGAFGPTVTGLTNDVNYFPGSSTTLSFPVTGKNYQWYHNGAMIPGATSTSLTLPNLQARSAGTYTLIVTSATGTTASYSSTVNVINLAGSATATPAGVRGHIGELSVRAVAGKDADSLIAGFAIDPTGARDVLIRALGPALTPFGVSGVLADPKLTLYRGGSVSAQNDDWDSTAFPAELAAAATRAGASPLAAGSKDAAIFGYLSPGTYSALVSTTAADATGVVLLEIWDASTSSDTSRLSQVSARAKVGTGDNVLLSGLVVGGTTPVNMLVRAIGPGLAGFGVTGALADPRLDIYQGTRLVASNDNWEPSAALTAATASTGAFALTPGSKDAATTVTLPPGIYTIQVSGMNAGTGVALLEVTEIP